MSGIPMRWQMLGLLFSVRTAMAIQYQSVATVSPMLAESYGVSMADIGFLIGLYLAPGIFLAAAGGKIGTLCGDKRTVLAGLALMLVGGTLMAIGPTWTWQVAGRLTAGTGAVLLNVLLAKMVVDWFADREIAAAMAIFVNSWPIGIGIALIVLPEIGVRSGIAMVYFTCLLLVAWGFLALARCYREPPAKALANGRPSDLRTALAVTTAALVWAFYNAGFVMVFGFGPAMLTAKGWSLEAAGTAVSIVLWLIALSVPLGGILTDRLGRPFAIIVVGCLASAFLLSLAIRTDHILIVFVLLGMVGGLPAGAIMSLPARILDAPTRAAGMGIFFTVFYLGMVLGPAMGGFIAQRLNSASGTFDFGCMLLVSACLWLLPYQYFTSRPAVRKPLADKL